MIWILSALLVAAIAAPWAYQIGKNFAQVAATQELSSVLESLGRSCGRAKLEKYFSRAMTISAILMIPLLMARIRTIRAASGVPMERRTPVGWKSGALQIVTGCLIAGGILLAMGMILTALGAYLPTPNPPELGKLLKRMLIPAAAASLLEEWLFRGLLLGLWLRFAKPLAASIGTSLLFAFVHFLAPPDGVVIANPASPIAGFELLGKILLHFTDPLFFVTDFATLFVIGMILATARLRTGALWFSIGLHAGWIAAFKGFNMLHRAVPVHELRPWGVGDSLRSGLLPMLALGFTAVICHFALKRFDKAGSLNPASR